MKYLILLIIFTGGAQAKILSCGQDEYANLNENCATCLPGYTKNPQGICVPEAPKSSVIVIVPQPSAEPAVLNYLPELLGNWVNQIALVTGASAAVFVVGGGVVIAIVATIFGLIKLQQYYHQMPIKNKSESRASTPSLARATTITPKRTSGGGRPSAGAREAAGVAKTVIQDNINAIKAAKKRN
jgi:hypothetical protein